MKMKDFELIIFSIALLASYYWLWEKIIDFLQFISSFALVSPKVLQSNKNIVIGWYLLLSTDPYNIQIKDDFAQYFIFHSTLIWWIVVESLEGNYRPMPMYGAILEKNPWNRDQHGFYFKFCYTAYALTLMASWDYLLHFLWITYPDL